MSFKREVTIVNDFFLNVEALKNIFKVLKKGFENVRVLKKIKLILAIKV